MGLNLKAIVFEPEVIQADTVETVIKRYNLDAIVSPVFSSISQIEKHTILSIKVEDIESVRLAGQTHYRKNTIFMNVLLPDNHYIETFLHELAHAIVYVCRLRTDSSDHHGIPWQRVMKQLGQKPERCHQLSHILRA